MARYGTPLRYPGGKQRLAPFIAEVLRSNGAVGWTYAEPYAGGAGVAIELLLAGLVKRIVLNDSAKHIFAFWSSVLDDTERFCRRISAASLSTASWKRHREVVRSPHDHDLFDLGFSTFYLNRCNRSGVLTGGMIGGLAQTGQWRLDARFPRKELIRRIEVLARYRNSIGLFNMDAECFMVKNVNKLPITTLVYCDPPYFARAERLYLNAYKPHDHQRLARVIQTELRRPWLVSYDHHPRIHQLYRGRRRFSYLLQYSAIQSYKGREIFVFSDSLRIPSHSSIASISDGLARSRLRPGPRVRSA